MELKPSSVMNSWDPRTEHHHSSGIDPDPVRPRRSSRSADLRQRTRYPDVSSWITRNPAPPSRGAFCALRATASSATYALE